MVTVVDRQKMIQYDQIRLIRRKMTKIRLT